MAVVFLAALGYAVLRSDTWKATQTLLVRDEAIGTHNRAGSFESHDSQKAAQELVLERARSRAVVLAAMKSVGPPTVRTSIGAYPNESEIASLQDNISVRAPNGVEFGKTDVLHLEVKAKGKARSIALAVALCESLDEELSEVREQKSRSLIDELDRSAKLASQDLAQATLALSRVETEVGRDLGELRILSESASGDSTLRQTLVGIEAELRTARTTLRTRARMLEMITSARTNPNVIMHMPNEMLAASPALKAIKEKLVASQLETAAMLSERTAVHPKVVAARAMQAEVINQLRGELSSAAGGLLADIEVESSRVAVLEDQKTQMQNRLHKLAAVRATYSNLTADVRHREELLKQSEQKLASVKASLSSAHSSSLITLLDEPFTGDSAVGPRRSIILFAGLVGGLLCGLGVLFLTVAPVEPNPTNERAANSRTQRPQHVREESSSRRTSPQSGLSLRDALTSVQRQGTQIWD